MGDFNLTVEDKKVEVFMSTFDMECLVKKRTCFHSAEPNSIKLILKIKKNFSKTRMF